MKVRAKSVKKASVKAAQPSETKARFPKIGSLLYRFLRGLSLFIPNVRKDDIDGQPFVALPKKATAAVAFTITSSGVCLSQVRAEGHVVELPEKELGFDMHRVGGKVMGVKEATAWAKKNGKAHVIRRKLAKKGVTENGYLIGDLAKMYVGWLNAKTGAFDTLETRPLPNGRNASRLFELVK